ncbi:cupin-like domain-containing protein [Sphingomonas nostoxanthinifaciens]|uniref:cupin-like domain-containing protein n=1 Tax=Sphingomonas nostoxanthinifaciens TaxID=2872652 RepID=UPI001CC20EF4|nr:cupin-like domain-containing protein [Sphingomonas nostoxanthinifaciens]UAK23380.1 cupin-like domain-containing protein [Sphingomonas nostoxanthinifaciens]
MPRAVRTLDAAEHAAIGDDALLTASEPLVVKGLARDWPLVRRGLESAGAALDYVQQFDAGRPVTAYIADPATGGRFTYNADLTAMGFKRERAVLADCLDRLREAGDDPTAQHLYIGSTDIDSHLPGFAPENPLPLTSPLLDAHPPLASIWIGNRSIAPAHWDMSNNIAVCAVGRRRFTLFPPDQAANLYPGPLEPTPAGQVVSMVDFDAPDFTRHPGFRIALAAAQVAELEPGDVLVYPALWWHQVEALDPVNMLVNYWWNAAGDFMDSPMVTILHGFLSLRDRPLAEKQAWRALFDYYLFGPAEAAAAHLPDHARGPLAPLDPAIARRLRAQVSARLQR